MFKEKANILYGQSGGPTSVINSSFYGLIKEANKHRNKIDKVICMHYGIEGLLNEDLFIIDPSDYQEYKKLENTSGAFFGSNRYKLKKYQEDETDYKKILEIFKKYNIRYFFYNGGNDSMDSIKKIDEYLKLNNYKCDTIGIPKTIDNDLIGTDFSFGFPSSAKFVINSILNVYNDDMSYKKGRVNIIEVMGRNAGWLTASSIILKDYGVNIDLIYLPEFSFNIDEFLTKVNSIYSKKGHCLVVISEGVKNENNKLIYQANLKKDEFNHHSLGGVSSFLASLVQENLNFKVRAIELSLLQRANSFSPSKVDLTLAQKASSFALKKVMKKDINNQMIKIEFNEDKYKFSFIDIKEVANKERKMDETYLDYSKKEIKDDYKKYIKRLIKGNVNTFSKNGIIDFLSK